MKTILNKIYSHLIESLEYEPAEVYVVGSFSFGDPDKHSDIDMCIISDVEDAFYFNSPIGFYDVKVWTDRNKIGTYHNRFTDEILKLSWVNLKTGEIIYGSDVDEFKYKQFKQNTNRIPKTRMKNTLSELWNTNLVNVLKK